MRRCPFWCCHIVFVVDLIKDKEDAKRRLFYAALPHFFLGRRQENVVFLTHSAVSNLT